MRRGAVRRKQNRPFRDRALRHIVTPAADRQKKVLLPSEGAGAGPTAKARVTRCSVRPHREGEGHWLLSEAFISQPVTLAFAVRPVAIVG